MDKCGGDTLQIEVNVMPGKGEIMLTGQLGDVMKESAQIAITLVKSLYPELQINSRKMIFTSMCRQEQFPRMAHQQASRW